MASNTLPHEGKSTITVNTKPCPTCKKVEQLEVYTVDWQDWRKGQALIQNAFPYLTAEQREQLLTGYCQTCWNALFADEQGGE